MPGMSKKWPIMVVSTIMLGFAFSSASSNEEVAHHKFPHHHLALFVGGGFERDKKDHEESGTALGLEYEVQFSDRWGVGVDVESLSGSGTHRSSVMAVPVSYHPNEKWRLFAGPGMEFGDKHDKFLARFGIGYEIPFQERWTASPEFMVDFVEGGATTYVLGIAIGFGF
jgi:hypothetical protein